MRGRVQTAYRVWWHPTGDFGVRHGGYVGQRNGAGRCLRQHPLRGAPLLPMTRYFGLCRSRTETAGCSVRRSRGLKPESGRTVCRRFVDRAAASACNLGEACWIWQTGGAADGRIPEGTQLFRRAFRLAEGKTVANAILLFTADDCGTVYPNGRQVGEIPRRTDAWKNGQAVDVTDRLTAGENLLAASRPIAGVGYARICRASASTYSDGSQESVPTNAQGWRVSRDRIADFASPDCDDSGAGWGAPDQSVRYGSGAWASLVTFSGGAALQMAMPRPCCGVNFFAGQGNNICPCVCNRGGNL